MSFFKINIQNQYTANKAANFDLKEFNQTFEDLNLVTQIDTISSDVPYEKSLSGNASPQMRLVDPVLAAGHNYYNPYEKDYIDPNQDSKNRLSLLALIDKFNKKILVITKPQRPTNHYYNFLSNINRNPYNNNGQSHLFYIPGGKCKIFESFENCALRHFQQSTRIQLDHAKITKLNCDKIYIKTPIFAKVINDDDVLPSDPENNHTQVDDVSFLEVCTYIAFVFDENTYKFKNPYCKWIPIKQLQYFNDKIFKHYYKSLYLAIVQYLY